MVRICSSLAALFICHVFNVEQLILSQRRIESDAYGIGIVTVSHLMLTSGLNKPGASHSIAAGALVSVTKVMHGCEQPFGSHKLAAGDPSQTAPSRGQGPWLSEGAANASSIIVGSLVLL